MENSKIFEPYDDATYEALIFDNNGECVGYYDPISSISINDLFIVIDNTYYDYDLNISEVSKIYVRPYDSTTYGWGVLNGDEILIYNGIKV